MKEKIHLQNLSLIWAFIWVLLSHQTLAQSESDTIARQNTPNFNFAYRLTHDVPPLVLNTFDNLGRVTVSPLGWKGKDWLLFGGVMSAGATAFIFDEQINNFAQSINSPATRTTAAIVEPFGDYKFAAIPWAFTWGLGLATRSSKEIETAYTGVQALLISSAFTSVFKFATQRVRPFAGEGPYEFYNPEYGFRQATSFPSNHAALAFAAARVFSEQYPNTIIPPLMYSLATLTALSRIHDQKHWGSDVVIGAALGYFIAGKIVKLRKNKNISLVVYPSFTF